MTTVAETYTPLASPKPGVDPKDQPVSHRAMRVVSLLCRIEDGLEVVAQYSRGEVLSGELLQSVLLGSQWTLTLHGDRVKRVDSPDARPLFVSDELAVLSNMSPEEGFIRRWRSSNWLADHLWPLSMPLEPQPLGAVGPIGGCCGAPTGEEGGMLA